MSSAVFAGTFDPFTFGHLDILERAAPHFDRIHVVVAHNPDKKTLFDSNERSRMIWAEISDWDLRHKVDVAVWPYLVGEWARYKGANVFIRGLRNDPKDLKYEMDLAALNRKYFPEMETVFIPSDPKFDLCSSSHAKALLASNAQDQEIAKKYLHWPIYWDTYHKIRGDNG